MTAMMSMSIRRRTTTDAAASRRATQAPPVGTGFSPTRSAEGRPPEAEASGVHFEAPSLLQADLGVRPEIASESWKATALPLWSRTQAIIGLLTGVLSIGGALYSG